LIFSNSDDGLIDKPKLVTCKFVNFVVHDGGLEYLYLVCFVARENASAERGRLCALKTDRFVFLTQT
jgi:hypothetical protein